LATTISISNRPDSGTVNSVIFNVGTFNGVNLNISKDAELESWGTTNIVGNLSASSKDINIYDGNFNISGSVDITDNGHLDVDGGRLVIGGHVTNSGTFHNKTNSELLVAGNFIINGNGSFSNECRTTISGSFINNKKADFDNASYTVITGSFTNNSNSEVSIKEGSVFKCASIVSNAKIKGSKAYSIIETGSIRFNGNAGFEGELDICSDSFTESMRNNKVINTCNTFISPSACSLGYNNVVDNDNDGAAAGVDVDDNNPNVSSYNYPQGEGLFFTSLYEDLYPCMGDYDLNDFVHNYSYQEGVLNGDINEIKFDYKFPAIGAGFNNSFVLRVMDDSNNAALTLDAASAYDSAEITRVHDTENNTTLFVFNNIKSIYTNNTGAIINTRQIDYADIPVISGTVTNVNGAYDEFILQNGEMGHEIHPLYNEFHLNYPALNAPSMYNDANNFSRCDDMSSDMTNLFINKNGFPWVLTDLPVDLPWPKEGISILEAFPNFDDFVISNPSLDWYTNINGNRNSANLID
jgi:LruC domain-containing protein